MKSSVNISGALMGLVILITAWQVLAWAIDLPILPAPLTVVPLFCKALFGELGLHLLASSARVLLATGLAVITAVPIGLGLALTPMLDRIFNPVIAVLYPLPKIVFLPVIYVLVGITDVSKIFLISLIIFFQILVVVRDEAVNLRPELIMSVRSLGAGRRGLLRYVFLPATLPAVLTALRVSVGTAIAVLFIVEQSLTTYGLGYYIVVETYQVLRYPEMYAGILAMGLLGLVFYFIVYAVERRVNRHMFLEDR